MAMRKSRIAIAISTHRCDILWIVLKLPFAPLIYYSLLLKRPFLSPADSLPCAQVAAAAAVIRADPLEIPSRPNRHSSAKYSRKCKFHNKNNKKGKIRT